MQLAHLKEMQQDQVQHYTALYEANRQVAVQRHDLKNILLNVRSYIEVGEIEKLDKYVAKFQEKLQPSKMIDNGMPFIDAVLSAKMAEHTEIPFELHIAPLQLEHLTQPQLLRSFSLPRWIMLLKPARKVQSRSSLSGSTSRETWFHWL